MPTHSDTLGTFICRLISQIRSKSSTMLEITELFVSSVVLYLITASTLSEFYCIYFIYYANINTVNCYLI